MKFFKVTVQSVLIFCVVSIVSTAVTVDNSAQNAAENLEKLPAENLEKVPAEIFVKVLDDIPAEVNADVSGKAPEKVTTEVLIDVSTNNSTVVSTDGSTEAPTNIEILCGAGDVYLVFENTLNLHRLLCILSKQPALVLSLEEALCATIDAKNVQVQAVNINVGHAVDYFGKRVAATIAKLIDNNFNRIFLYSNLLINKINCSTGVNSF